MIFKTTTTKGFLVTIALLVGFSQGMSVRRQLTNQPTTIPPTTSTESSPAELRVDRVPSEFDKAIPQEQGKNPSSEFQPSALDASTINHILDLLRRDVGGSQSANSGRALDGTGGSPGQEASEQDQLRISTGDPKVDDLLAGLEKPSENSKAVWMALLHGLMSDGSLNELLGNFVQEAPRSAKRDGQVLGASEGRQNLLEEGGQQQQFVDQLEGPIPQTQMEEFILEPHLGPAIMPFELPEGFFVSFLPRRAFGVVNGVARPAHGHGSFYVHRPPGLVDVINPPAFGFLFNGYRRFDPEIDPSDERILHFDDQLSLLPEDQPLGFEDQQSFLPEERPLDPEGQQPLQVEDQQPLFTEDQSVPEKERANIHS